MIRAGLTLGKSMGRAAARTSLGLGRQTLAGGASMLRQQTAPPFAATSLSRFNSDPGVFLRAPGVERQSSDPGLDRRVLESAAPAPASLLRINSDLGLEGCRLLAGALPAPAPAAGASGHSNSLLSQVSSQYDLSGLSQVDVFIDGTNQSYGSSFEAVRSDYTWVDHGIGYAYDETSGQLSIIFSGAGFHSTRELLGGLGETGMDGTSARIQEFLQALSSSAGADQRLPLNVRGYSRGAVTAMIVAEDSTDYDVSLIAFDPVPGPASSPGMLDLTGAHIKASVIQYSLENNIPLFDPQLARFNGLLLLSTGGHDACVKSSYQAAVRGVESLGASGVSQPSVRMIYPNSDFAVSDPLSADRVQSLFAGLEDPSDTSVRLSLIGEAAREHSGQ